MKTEIAKSDRKTIMIYIEEKDTLFIRYNNKDNFRDLLNWINAKMKENNYYKQKG